MNGTRNGTVNFWISATTCIEFAVEVDVMDEYESDGRGGYAVAREVEADEIRVVSAHLVVTLPDGTEVRTEVQGPFRFEEDGDGWVNEHRSLIRWA